MAPFGHGEVMLKELHGTVFAGRNVKMHCRGTDGTATVVTVASAVKAAAAPTQR
jgi:hemolysin-activating ACP:hemolysin acyltransferase